MSAIIERDGEAYVKRIVQEVKVAVSALFEHMYETPISNVHITEFGPSAVVDLDFTVEAAGRSFTIRVEES